MDSAALLADSFARIPGLVHRMLDDAAAPALLWRPDPEANTVAWLVWHIGRGQDVQVASLADREQVWTAQGFADRFALPFDDAEMGYGQDPDDVGLVQAPADLLAAYVDAVTTQSLEVIASLSDADLDRVVDEGWDPPVTVGTRLISVIGDCLQHAGQAAYLLGLWQRRAA